VDLRVRYVLGKELCFNEETMMEIAISLLTLILLEVVLGIDNIIFLTIISGKLPPHQQKKARRVGLILALLLRLAFLGVIGLVIQMKEDLFVVLGHGISGKDIVVISGGLFLLFKSTTEIFHKVEGHESVNSEAAKYSGFAAIIIQIMVMNLIFSVDSIITAIGMAKQIWVMGVAVIASIGIMMVAAEPVSKFVNTHPAFKILALAFLLLIGFSLFTEGLGFEVPKGYIYFAMAFSLLVDILQMKAHKTKSVT
jgi:predicted tellurium resistance membrane protein TerC